MSALLMSQRDVAKLLGRSPRKIREWTAAGRLPTWVDASSGRTYYPRQAVERVLAEIQPTEVAS